MTQAPNETPAPEAKPPAAKRGWRFGHILLIAVSTLLVLLVLGVVALRYAALTPSGRAFVAARLEGLPVGTVGKLHIEGLDGDILHEFTVRRLAIVDAKGAWLDAREVRVRWDWPALLLRRVQVDALAADRVLVSRPPVTSAQTGPGGPSPVSVILEDVGFRLETLPAISVQRGLFQVNGRLDLEREGGLRGELHGRSLLHLGDGLDARFNLGIGDRLVLVARAREAQGGAIAGLAGLPADRTFFLDADAEGQPDHGVIRAQAQSGADSIAKIDGAWTPSGGSGRGRVSLAASRWTAGWMKALGPEVRVSGSGRGLGHNLYDLSVLATSDNATVSAGGQIDSKRAASPKGLKIQLGVNDLSRIVQTPAMGRGQIGGVLSGRWGDWTLAGQASVERLTWEGLTLARVSGPASLSYGKREWRLKADARGVGGQRQGWFAALAGVNPHAVLDGSLLADGRLLMRSLDAQGAGLKLQASGTRSLFGALDLKGQAQLSNLAAARAGARGQIAARWSADQARPDSAWTVAIDASGADFATGQAEIDRLLGAKPTLQLAGVNDGGAITLSKAVLTGAAAKVSASGDIGKAGELKLAVDWSAAGPFTAGPMEITGEAKGTGEVGGDIAQPRIALLADFQQIALPNLTLRSAHTVLSAARSPSGVAGSFTLAASSDYGLAHARAGFDLHGDGLSLTDIDAAAGGASLAGAVALHGQRPSTADLTLAVGPGAFAAQGHAQAQVKIADDPGGATGAVTVTAEDLQTRGSSTIIAKARFAGHGPLAHLPYTIEASTVTGDWPVTVDGSGVLSQIEPGFNVSFSGSGRVRKADFHTLSPAEVDFAGARRTARLDLALGGGEARVGGEMTDQSIDGQATLTDVDLAALGEDIVGKVSGDVAVKGEGEALGGMLDARLSGARSRDAAAKLALDGQIHAVLAGSRITLDASASGAGAADKASLNLVLPAVAAAAPFRIAIARTQPIAGRFQVDGELQPIWDLFFGGEQSMGGALTARGAIEGTLNSPKLTGHANLAQGRFEDAVTGLKLKNLAADVELSETQVDVRQFAGQDAKSGTVSGAGQFSLAAGGESTLTLNVKNFQLLDNDDAKATATGAVTVVRGGDGKFRLSGGLDIDQATISPTTRTPPGVVGMDVVERNLPVEQVLRAPAPANAGPDVVLDIKLSAPRRIFVRGLGLNAELSLNAQVGGTIANPDLSGVARVVRGDYDFAGKRFEIDDQSAIYLATDPEKIRLDLSATWDDNSTLTAMIKIGGTAAKPKITLTSTPALPQDEVLSQVLFGASASQLSPVEAAQLAAAVTTLATGGGFDVMGGLSRFARLDRLALGGDQTSGVTVSGGKYIGNHVYLELTGGGRQPPSAQLEYRANRAFSFISQVGGLGGAKLSFRWRHDYGKAPLVNPAKPKSPASPPP